MHIAYPNVVDNRFIGCGRYLSLPPEHQVVKEKYREADPDITNRNSAILMAVERLAQEWAEHEHKARVWERRDDPSGPYWGRSLELAYLLATIRCVRSLAIEACDSLGDLWCTGVVGLVDNKPFLHGVDQEGFDLKLREFVTQARDQLFFVPATNLSDALTDFCDQHQVRVLSLQKFAEILHTAGQEKLVVPIRGDQLPLLVDILFQSPRRTGSYRCALAVLVGLILLAFGAGRLILPPRPFQPQLRAIEEQASSPPLLYSESGLRHAWIELTSQQQRLARAISAAEDIFHRQHGHYIPVQDTTVSQMMRTVGATAHDKDFVIERMQIYPELDRRLKNIDALVERVESK